MASPCDAIIGACGAICDNTVLQAKGFPYRLNELTGDSGLGARFENGSYVTLRLTSSMYHRFHAPHDLDIERVTYISGDTWNVNPIALKRVENLFCRNERAVIEASLTRGGAPIALIPVAAVLVASIRLHFIEPLLHLRYRGPRVLPCAAHLGKGEEMGWFEHGSTIILLLPVNMRPLETTVSGRTIRAGAPLSRMP